MLKAKLRELILMEIFKDEYEYCFDTSYTSDNTWKELHGGKSRVQAFVESILHYSNASLEEIFNDYGDKYNYVVEGFIKSVFEEIEEIEESMESQPISVLIVGGF